MSENEISWNRRYPLDIDIFFCFEFSLIPLFHQRPPNLSKKNVVGFDDLDKFVYISSCFWDTKYEVQSDKLVGITLTLLLKKNAKPKLPAGASSDFL